MNENQEIRFRVAVPLEWPSYVVCYYILGKGEDGLAIWVGQN